MRNKFKKTLSIVIIIFSLIGLYASFVLTVERIATLKEDTLLSCDLNSVISCSSVMKTPQAELLGFPNSLMGIIGYSMVLIVGIALFLNFDNRKFYISAALGMLGAFLFSYWLLFESIFRIGFLCPYCLLSCLAATNIFFMLILLCLKENYFALSESNNVFIQNFIKKQQYFYFIGLWHFLIFAGIFLKYREALFS